MQTFFVQVKSEASKQALFLEALGDSHASEEGVTDGAEATRLDLFCP